MRRHFLGKFVVVLGVAVVAIVGLSALAGVFFSRGEGDRGPFFPIGLVVVVLVVLLVVRAGRRFASPIVDVMEAADRVAAGDYESRVEVRGPREVQRLGAAFNAMTERLGSNEDRRRQLLADVAHELRTPLSVIQANLEALVDGLYPADETHLRSVLDETKVMARLLNDLQTLSTAEAGALTLHLEPTEPRHLIESAVRSFAAQAGEAGVRLDTRVAESLPEIEVDRLRIGEVLGNVLSNALRHTAAGGSVTLEAFAAGEGVSVSIADTGTGIPPERLPHVFARFSRAADSPGTGLGLAIAKSLIEAHGGEIRAESTGAGTTISFTLPG
ncbi:MAG: integral rane sensor signal transduction histidine kinase [Actinomycetia bacterium]|jgi:signal transduction histidine kinase|nr:integral rane sensor signal transduction histidine kinase [Actinomycetes bacterium]